MSSTLGEVPDPPVRHDGAGSATVRRPEPNLLQEWWDEVMGATGRDRKRAPESR